jgi:hypothetical protein
MLSTSSEVFERSVQCKRRTCAGSQSQLRFLIFDQSNNVLLFVQIESYYLEPKWQWINNVVKTASDGWVNAITYDQNSANGVDHPKF